MSVTTLQQIEATRGLSQVDLDDRERTVLAQLAAEVASEASREPDSLARLTADAARSLPQRLLELGEEAAVWPPRCSGWMIRKLPIEEGKLGATPESWRQGLGPTTPEDCQLLLIGWAMGVVFAWADQQGGAPVHNIVPVAGEEESLLSSSSTMPLALHTEDAYFDQRADLLLLLCLRNPSQAATYVSDVRDVELTEDELGLVCERRYFFGPDGSHNQSNQLRASRGFPVARATSHEPVGPSALTGLIEADPWLRCDIDYIDAGDDERAMDAARALDRALHRARAELVLRSGELLVIDNRCCVHGRGKFNPDYSGRDRWLKRVNVSIRERT